MEEFGNDLVEQGGDEELDKDGKKRKKRPTDRFLETLRRLFEAPAKRETKEHNERESLRDRLSKLIFGEAVLKPEYIVDHRAPVLDENLSNTYEAMPTEPDFKPEDAEPTMPDREEVVIDHAPIEGGELTIEHDEVSQPVTELEPQLDEALANKSESKAPEQVGSIVQRMGKEQAPSSSAALAQEMMRERREKKTRRDMKRLKQRTRQQDNRQKTLAKRQQELESQLNTQIEREDAAKRRVAQERLRGYGPASPETVQQSSVPAESQPARPELNPEQLRQLVEPAPETTRPEEVLRRVEAAAERDLPIEQLYERRHEVKDEELNQPVVQSTAGATSQTRYSAPAVPPVYKPVQMQTVPVPEPTSTQPPSQDLYRQAVRNGFWGAIAILLLILVASLVK